MRVEMAQKVSQSRTARWMRAVDQGRQAHEKLQGIIDEVNDDLAEAFQTLVDGLQEAIDTSTSTLRSTKRSSSLKSTCLVLKSI
jgi:DNA-binding transcriptional regulator GbsR (MarR family)